MVKASLNYEKKIWGRAAADLSIFNNNYLSLKYCFQAIKGAKGKLLDIGCSAGAFTSAIKKYRPDFEITGLDSSKRCIQIAKKKHKSINFVCRNIGSSLLKSKEYDVITAKHVMEHLNNPESALKEIYRLLKPDGIFYSSTPLEGHWSSLVRWLRLIPVYKNNRVAYLGHEQAYGKKKYFVLLKKAGFKIESVYWEGFIFYQIIDAVYYPWLKLFGKKPEYLMESEVIKSNDKLFMAIFTVGKGFLNFLANIESLILYSIPGFIIHVKARKI